MKVFAFILVAIGVLSLVYGGITYNRERTLLDVGPIKATTTEQKNIPITPIVGAIAIVGGIVMLTMSRKRIA